MAAKMISTKNDLSGEVRMRMSEMLNQQLADIIDLRMQAKQAHWNVRGPRFIGLHELFDKVAEDLAELADEIAERCSQFGAQVSGTVQAVVKASRLAPYPDGIVTGREHVEALSSSLAKFCASTRAAIEEADDADDTGTEDLLTGVSLKVDKLLWMVEAHLQAEE